MNDDSISKIIKELKGMEIDCMIVGEVFSKTESKKYFIAKLPFSKKVKKILNYSEKNG